jgi:hypothetical protein
MSSPTNAKFKPLLTDFAKRAHNLSIRTDALTMLTGPKASWKLVGNDAQCSRAVAAAVDMLKQPGDRLKVAEFVRGVQYDALRKEMAALIKTKVPEPDRSRLLGLLNEN